VLITMGAGDVTQLAAMMLESKPATLSL
jgi:hypothetical protein